MNIPYALPPDTYVKSMQVAWPAASNRGMLMLLTGVVTSPAVP